jgi:outer membrane cobalamin receptor
LELHGALSTLDARDPEDGSAMLYRPAAKGSLAVVLKRWSWELAGRLQWVGERLFDDFLDSSHALPDPVTGRMRFPRRTLEAYAMLDLDLRWRGKPLEVALHLTNLLDSRAYVIQGYPPPGREWFLEARIPWP